MAIENKQIIDYTLKIRLPVIGLILIVTIIYAYYYSKPIREKVGYQPLQPINFSHKQHVGKLKLDCIYCHTTVKKSRYASVPSTNICINCHRVVRTERPEIIKLNNYYNQNIPIPWKRIHKLPEYAYFDHSAHVNGGLQCASCHGSVEKMDHIKQIRSFNMSDCLSCHRNAPQMFPHIKGIKKAPVNCYTCHR